MKQKYTIFYIVGGEEKYYDQLLLSIKSVYKYMPPGEFKIKILDLGNRNWNTNEVIEVVKLENNINKSHIFWKYKYFICQQLDTQYGLYLDCDTVMCSNRAEEIFEGTRGKFGAIKHFHVEDFGNLANCFPSQEAKNYRENEGLSVSQTFYTGGVFFFHKTESCLRILKETFEKHNKYYATDSEPYIDGLYDETFLSTVLAGYDHSVVNGSANHCSAEYMPLEIREKKLFGCNPFEERQEIFILHGSSERQKLGLDFSGELRKEIIKKWNP